MRFSRVFKLKTQYIFHHMFHFGSKMSVVPGTFEMSLILQTSAHHQLIIAKKFHTLFPAYGLVSALKIISDHQHSVVASEFTKDLH